ncbi:MAG: efflux RND transporter permease subunit [Candidatus Marinarcus sp.]|uniref:efflux RND transporter permease subunit n=1 Tax=Candidatus Marinarcus sp. TaxID=3100987 RepID=UPI003AFF85A7
MLERFFKTIVLPHPKKVLAAIFLCVAFLAFYATKLEIDASADTLLLENDHDLKFSRIIGKRYDTPDFLLITFTPKEDLLSKKSLATIADISKDLEKLPRVNYVTSILTVPLLQSPVKELKDLVNDVPTLQKNHVDKVLAKQEFLTSPLYKNALVSSDFKTTAILVNLKYDQKYFDLIDKKEELQQKKADKTITLEEEKQFNAVLLEYKKHKDLQRVIEHQNIEEIRKVMEKYKDKAQLFLGGVNMIVDDIITYVKSDLYIYGTTLLAILIVVLWLIFKQLRWIVIPVIVCLLSVISTSGVLGLFGWEVTVISSNFISLQLIITISIVLHLIVRYNEVNATHKEATQEELVLETVLSKAKPSFFAIITTIAGFSSLIVSGIKPVINLGWMMSTGIAISLLLAFLVFPSIMMLLKKVKTKKEETQHSFSMTKLCSNTVLKYGNAIIYISIIVFIFSVVGASKLIVENSFISYFKKTTEIYKGMEVIDQKLGGTTPLDIILDFKTMEVTADIPSENQDDMMDSFEDEFAQSKDEPQYWFTPDKMEKIMKVHDYLSSIKEIGNVQSLATLLKVGQSLNHGKDLDNFQLALLYTQLPQEYKKLILSPYISIEHNQARFATRIIDSNENLRRNELLNRIKRELKTVVSEDEGTFRLSSLMVLYNNMLQSLFESQILTLGIVVIMLSIMFLILFRSIAIALIAMVVNIVPIGIIFGLMGFAHIPLDIMTITIAAISIGIGVDDTIHYIHRFKEEYETCGDYVEAMKRAHQSIGYAMYYTSLAIMLGFSILVVSNFIPTIYFGLLTVLVMFMVLLADLLLLPKLLLHYKPFSK